MPPLKDVQSDLRFNRSTTSDSDRSRKPWIVMIWMLALAPALSVIVTPRVFDAHLTNFIAAGAEHHGIIPWFIGKLQTYGIFTVAFIFIAKYKQKSRSKSSGGLQKLLMTIILYSLVPFLVTLATSKTRPTLGMLGLPFVFTATYYLPSISPEEIAKHVRIALAALYIYGTILAVIIAPDWAIESGYSTELSYVDFRLYGMAVHANTLSSFLFIFLVLGWIPGARFRMEKLHVFLAVMLMVVAQSKTIILIFLIILLLKLSAKFINKMYARKTFRYSAFILIPLFATTAISFALKNKYLLEITQNPEVMSLTGRLNLWIITYTLWLEKPWFGHGMDLWSTEMQLDYASLMGGWLAPHAHNQLLQTLGESGVVGATLLLIIYCLLGKESWKLFSFTGGVSFFLFIYLVLRSLTEVPIVLQVTQSNFYTFWIIYALLIAAYKWKIHGLAT